MITVTIKGRIRNVAFLEREGARRIFDGRFPAYQMDVADVSSAILLARRIEGDDDNPGYEKVWCEWTNPEDAILDEEPEEIAPIFAGWQSVAAGLAGRTHPTARAMGWVTNEDCWFQILENLDRLERNMVASRSLESLTRLREVRSQLQATSLEAAAAYYATVREEIRTWAALYWA